MSSRLFAVALALWFMVVAPAAWAGSIGAFIGLNRSGLSGDAPPNTTYQSSNGLIAGLRGEIALSDDVSLGVEPMFAQRGAGIAYAASGGGDPIDSLEVVMDYLAIPVVLRIYTGGGRTYVTGGLDVAFLRSATLSGRGPDEDAGDFFKDADIAALFGFGVIFPIGKPRLSLELRYFQGLVNISNDDGAPAGADLPDRFRSSGLQLMAGINLPIGGAR